MFKKDKTIDNSFDDFAKPYLEELAEQHGYESPDKMRCSRDQRHLSLYHKKIKELLDKYLKVYGF